MVNINEEITLCWDNEELVETDWELNEFWDILEMLKKMPTLDNEIFHFSQYINTRYWTWCTIASAINLVWTRANYKFTEDEISKIYDLAEEMWFKPGFWWARWLWLNVVRKWWNAKFPDNQFMSFVIDLFSEEYELVKQKLWVLQVSIRVDSAYWRDARDNLVINKDEYKTSWWHATVMSVKDAKCIDSIPQFTNDIRIKTPMIYSWEDEARIDRLNQSGNIRTDAHIIIFANWLKPQIDDAEKKRLEDFRTNLLVSIEANSRLRHLTNSQTEKEERNKMNNYNRDKLKVVESLLNN